MYSKDLMRFISLYRYFFLFELCSVEGTFQLTTMVLDGYGLIPTYLPAYIEFSARNVQSSGLSPLPVRRQI